MASLTLRTVAICLMLYFSCSYATILDLRKTLLNPSTKDSNYYLDYFEPVWALHDAPYGTDQPFVELNLSLTNNDGATTARAFVFPWVEYSAIGSTTPSDQSIAFCCTESVRNSDVPCDLNQPIYTPNENISKSDLIDFANGPTVNLSMTVNVTVSDLWNVMVVTCGTTTNVTVTGTIIWKNAFGYLKAGFYRLLPFYLVMAIFYILFGLAYFVLCVIYRHDILRVQLGIASIFLIGMMETFSWYAYYRIVDETGYYPTGTTAFGILFTVFKRTAAISIALLVCMGLGVTKLSVGTTKYKIALLALVFALTTGIFERYHLDREQLRYSPSEPDLSVFVMLTMFAVTHLVFFWWIFVSLVRTTHQLSLRRQVDKLVLFKRLLYVLIITVVATALLLLFALFAQFVNDPKTEWKRVWVAEMFGELGFLILLLIMAWLWRPRNNNTRYGMAELVGEDDNTSIQLSPIGGELTQRGDSNQPTPTQYESDREKNIKATTGASQAELQVIENLASFALNDEDEEEDQVALAKGKLD